MICGVKELEKGADHIIYMDNLSVMPRLLNEIEIEQEDVACSQIRVVFVGSFSQITEI